MGRTGAADLPLHGGRAPSWLVSRMKKLAKPIIRLIVDEYGRDEFLRRLSDPYWFQSLGCVLGYDFHSSGLTTVTTGILKDAIEPSEIGIFAAGGKGKASTRTLDEIDSFSREFNFSNTDLENFKYSSKLTAKVDNTAVQAGAPLYHHAFFASEDGGWAVVQQGMNAEEGVARRYHWLSEGVRSFVEEPHKGIVAEKTGRQVLDMTAKISEECRDTSVDLVNDGPSKVKRDFDSLVPKGQKTLVDWIPGMEIDTNSLRSLDMPMRMNWEALERTYELQPENYEELIGIQGVGPATTRGLALVSEIVYGESPSKEDPAKYSFAFGGKDGVPYPVNRESMDKADRILRSAIEEAEIGKKDKLKAIKRLKKFEDKPVSD